MEKLPESIPESFAKVVNLGLELGFEEICNLEGAMIMDVDENWAVALNGHEEPVDVPQKGGCMGVSALPPFTIAIFWNGWIAGMVNVHDGAIAFGELANEDTFIEAVEAAIKRAKEEKC